MISIRMMKICDTSICRPLKLIFQSCLEGRRLSTEWKNAVHKKGDKQLLKKTADQYRYFLLLVRSLKDYGMTGCLIFS